MTTDTTLTGLTSNPTPPPATIDTSAGSTQISADFDMFLQMLTAQMQYQDPLNPIESTDYATQLATFSEVEQAVLTNDLLTSLTEQLTADGLADMAAWVGKEARSSAPYTFDGSALDLPIDVAAGADQAMLLIQSPDGQELAQLDLAPGTDQLGWTGQANDGATMPAGAYRFEVVSLQQGSILSQSPVTDYRLVTEVQISNGQTQLVFEDGTTATTAEVSALRSLSEG